MAVRRSQTQDHPSVNVSPRPSSKSDLRPWFMIHGSRPQEFLNLPSPPVLHPARLTAYHSIEIWPGTSVLRPAPPMVTISGSAYYPKSPAEVTKLESCAVKNLKVRDITMEIWRENGKEEVQGRAVVYMGSSRALEKEIAECRAGREKRRSHRSTMRKEKEGRLLGWLGAVHGGEKGWEEEVVDWEAMLVRREEDEQARRVEELMWMQNEENERWMREKERRDKRN